MIKSTIGNSHPWRGMGIIKPLAHRADAWYYFSHGSSSDDPVRIKLFLMVIKQYLI